MLDAYACLRHEPWTARIDYGRAELAIGFPQHPDQHRPERPILLAVDQVLREGTRLRVPPELADRVGASEVGEDHDVEQFGGALTYARPTPQSGALSQ